MSLLDAEGNKLYDILTTGEPAHASRQQGLNGGVKATPVVLDAVDKTDAHTSGAAVHEHHHYRYPPTTVRRRRRHCYREYNDHTDCRL